MKRILLSNEKGVAFFFLLMTALALLLATPAAATTVTASPSSCTSVSGTGVDWSNASNAVSSNESWATVQLDDWQVSDFLQCTGYNFAIPSGATINGITVSIERSASTSSALRDSSVMIVKGGSRTGTDKADTSTYYPYWVDTVANYGGSGDLWGTTWVDTDINASNFGVALKAVKNTSSGGGLTLWVDHIQITVDYTASGGGGAGGVSGGCSSSTVGSDTVVTCTSAGTFTPPTGVSTVRYLIVAGGGGGGGIESGNAYGSGGGGAGGVLTGSSFGVTPGSSYSITVGAGGTGGVGGSTRGGSGGSSTFSSLTATGGGGGASQNVSSNRGASGGSGGGGRSSGTGGSGTSGQGNSGGNGSSSGGAAGGGGAGVSGSSGSGTNGGNGGVGVSSDITGTATYYGGGGGGGWYGSGSVGAGGSGGGASAVAARAAGVAATANTGGGGSGASGSSSGAAFNGGTGGSGIVILRYTVGGSTTAGYVESSPTTCTNDTTVGTVAWTSPGNAISSNDSRASANLSAGATSNYLRCVGFDFSAVPSGATISGITVSVERNVSASTTRVKDAYVYLLKAGVISTAYAGATTTSYGTTDATETHGGSGTLWNTTWTRSDVTDANFGVAFAAKNTSGWTTYTAGVDHVKVRVDYTSPALHHIRIEHDGTASTCAPESITLKACADANCTSNYTGGDVTGVNLSPTSGSTWSPSSSPTISGGVNSAITLARSTAGTATLAITGTISPAPASSYDCRNTATGSSSCDLVFASSSFSFDVPNHTADTRQTVTLTSCNASFASQSRNVKFWTGYSDPSSGTQQAKIVAGSGNTDCATGYTSVSTASGSPTTVALSFGSGSSPAATFSLCYPDAGKVVLNTQYNGSAATGDNGTLITGSDEFIAKPDSFALSAIKRTSDNVVNPGANDATGTAFIAAGSPFTATVTAKNARGATMPNYGQESVQEGVRLTIDSLVAPSGGATGLLTCNASTTDCAATGFSSGSKTLTDLAWDDVGVIKIMAKVSDADYLGTGDVTTPTASGNVGRFYPHHFGVTPDPGFPLENRADLCQDGVPLSAGACPSGFTYMGEQMALQFDLAALTAGDAVTSNYNYSAMAAQNFAKLNPGTSSNATPGNTLGLAAVDTATPTYLTSRLTTGTVTGSFSGGTATISVPVTLIRAAAPDGPYGALALGVAPVDSDGVTVAAASVDLDADATPGNDHVAVGTTQARYGRLRVSNAFGSEKTALALPLQAQYWSGSSWVINNLDSLTNLPANAFFLSGGIAASTSVSGAVLMSSGSGTLSLTAPNTTGSVDIAINLGSSGSDSSCLSSHGGTAAGHPWLRSQNGNCTASTTYAADPSARATFGIYTPESRRTIHVREAY